MTAIVPDTSLLIEGVLSKAIVSGEVSCSRIIIHEACLAELEHQANEERATGWIGLDEIERLVALGNEHGFTVSFSGSRPSPAQISHARLGEIDAMIRQLAFEEDAEFYTADKVQAKVAQSKGMKVRYFHKELEVPTLELEKYFDDRTMSVHLREGVVPIGKLGKPGDWEFKELDTSLLSRDALQRISREIVEQAGQLKDAFIEIERPGSTIVQLGRYRIVITKPPFSDGWEITAVRPVRKLTLDEYELSEKLLTRLDEHAEGVLIAGSPGMGKSTFAAALTEYYASQGMIVKTIEAPRDLVLPESITQYAISHGTSEEVHDVLLLSRPDYTLFDEMRNTKDFALFADLRLSGIGLAGVIHATAPIDAIQRFMGRIELGVIPQVIDTVIFIKNGHPDTVLSLEMTVKVPEGMTEADLARPVVVVSDFESGKAAYELYTYGEQTVVIPLSKISKEKASPHLKLAAGSVKEFFKAYSSNVEVEMASSSRARVFVPEKAISAIIGKAGANISRIEKELGISLDIKPLTDFEGDGDESVAFTHKVSKAQAVLDFGTRIKHRQVDLFLDGKYLSSGQVGKDGKLKVQTNHKAGKMLVDGLNDKRIIAKLS